MRICLISVEIFAWGKYGGFGRATRTIGRELVERGHDVYAVVPRREGQGPVEKLDGMTVLSFPPRQWLAPTQLLREADAEIYHSCEPSFGTYLAERALPDRVHVVTCRDPRDWEDWKTEFALPSRSRLRVVANYVYENGPLVRRGVQRADAVYTAAKCLIPKATSMYRLERSPVFLPTPIEIPAEVQKAATPTVCFVGRLDRRKRPELFLDLAAQFPAVRFIAVGASNDRDWDRQLHERYGSLPNLDMRGFVDQFRSDELSRILGESWIIINTSAREGLPNSMLEAAAHRCAVLSSVDPDDFATSFGHHVRDDDFAAGLRHLLENDRWRECGQAACRYVASTFATGPAIEGHIAAYRGLLERKR
jgi:glycosyltransferase involved in cell wall biosynthesis